MKTTRTRRHSQQGKTHQLHDEDDEVSDDGYGADAGEISGDEPEGVFGGPAERRAEDGHLFVARAKNRVTSTTVPKHELHTDRSQAPSLPDSMREKKTQPRCEKNTRQLFAFSLFPPMPGLFYDVHLAREVSSLI